MPRISWDVRIEIAGLSKTRMSQRNISAATGIGLKTVNCTLQATKKDGRIKNTPQRPRSCATRTDEGMLIVATVVDDPIFTAHELKHLQQLNAYVATIRRLLEAGLHCRIVAQKPLLYDHIYNARLAFVDA